MTLGELTSAIRQPSVDLNRLVVALYRLLGFAALATILLGLVSYLLLHAFFFLSASWVTPSVVSPTDPRALQMSSQIAQEQLLFDRLMAEADRAQARVSDLERGLRLAQRYQVGAMSLLRSDLEEAIVELKRVAALSGQASASRKKVVQSQNAYESTFRDRLQKMHKAQVINDGDFVKGTHQLSQLELTELGLAERNVELSSHVRRLRRRVAAIQGALARLESDPGDSETAAEDSTAADTREAAPTLEVLRIEHEVRRAGSDAKRAEADLVDAAIEHARLRSAINRQEDLLSRLLDSPYQRASSHELTVAFVPYENIGVLEAGAPVYACHVGPLLCRQVGKLGEALAGEVKGKHPLRNLELRGVLVELALRRPESVEHAVLHVGRPPLLL